VNVFQHQEQRTGARLGADEVLPGAPHLVAEHHRVSARRLQRDAGVVGERSPDQLAEELGDSRASLGRDVSSDARCELASAQLQRIVVDDAGRALHHGRQHPEYRAGAARIGPPDPHPRAAVGEACDQLTSQP
jgi:hypothetical protein